MRKYPRYSPDDPRVIACKKAIKEAGGYTHVGRIFHVSPQAVFRWEIVSAERCEKMEEISGVSIYELRPDIFVRYVPRLVG